MQETISKEKLEAFSEQFHSEPRNEVAMRAVVSEGVNKAAANHESLRRQRHEFSVSLKQGEITNQKQSGPLLDVRGAQYDAVPGDQKAESGDV